MRYFIDSSDGGNTWYVMDMYQFTYLKQAYANQYMAQTECDRLNALMEEL